MRAAFKEWGVIVDALGRGDQVIILRKGGIDEGRGGFKMEHARFLLFPTLFHQQRDSVVPAAQSRYDEIAPNFPAPETLRLEFYAEVVLAKKLNSLAEAQALRGQHVWRGEVVAQRFDWGRDRGIFALAARIFRLPRTMELPMLPAYGGCKSWIDLDCDIDSEGARPVLADAAFAAKLNQFTSALAIAKGSTLSASDTPQSPASSAFQPVSTG